jgi:hypothetical protein
MNDRTLLTEDIASKVALILLMLPRMRGFPSGYGVLEPFSPREMAGGNARGVVCLS